MAKACFDLDEFETGAAVTALTRCVDAWRALQEHERNGRKAGGVAADALGGCVTAAVRAQRAAACAQLGSNAVAVLSYAREVARVVPWLSIDRGILDELDRVLTAHIASGGEPVTFPDDELQRLGLAADDDSPA